MPDQQTLDAQFEQSDIERRLHDLEVWKGQLNEAGIDRLIQSGYIQFDGTPMRWDSYGQQMQVSSGGTTMVYFVPTLSADPTDQDIRATIQGVISDTNATIATTSNIVSKGLQGGVYTYALDQVNDVAGIRLYPITPDINQNTYVEVYALRPNSFGSMVLTNTVLRIGSFTSDPATLADGDIWYRSDVDTIYARVNGSTVAVSTGGGGGVATDVIWNAAGDLAVGTGADTATVLSGSSEDSYYLRYSTAINSPVWYPWLKVSNQTGDFTASGGNFYRVTATATVTMPTASIDGRMVRIINVGSGNVTVNRTSSDTFFYGTTGLTSHTILPGECFTYTAYATGNEWLVS